MKTSFYRDAKESFRIFAASEFNQVIRDDWDVSLRTLRNTTCVLN